MADTKMNVIEECDFTMIERLAEFALDEDIKSFLLREFGVDGGRINIYNNMLRALDECDGSSDCSDCCACIPYRDDLLIVEIAQVLSAYNADKLDLVSGRIIADPPEVDPYDDYEPLF
jgi:hypothetical protein